MKMKVSIIVLSALLSFSLAGCGSGETNHSSSTAFVSNSENEQTNNIENESSDSLSDVLEEIDAIISGSEFPVSSSESIAS